jgi:hypothetical protein
VEGGAAAAGAGGCTRTPSGRWAAPCAMSAAERLKGGDTPIGMPPPPPPPKAAAAGGPIAIPGPLCGEMKGEGSSMCIPEGLPHDIPPIDWKDSGTPPSIASTDELPTSRGMASGAAEAEPEPPTDIAPPPVPPMLPSAMPWPCTPWP